MQQRPCKAKRRCKHEGTPKRTYVVQGLNDTRKVYIQYWWCWPITRSESKCLVARYQGLIFADMRWRVLTSILSISFHCSPITGALRIVGEKLEHSEQAVISIEKLLLREWESRSCSLAVILDQAVTFHRKWRTRRGGYSTVWHTMHRCNVHSPGNIHIHDHFRFYHSLSLYIWVTDKIIGRLK